MTQRKWTRLKVERAARGVTQQELADESGIPEWRIAKLETLRLRPSERDLLRLAKVFEIDPQDLEATVE